MPRKTILALAACFALAACASEAPRVIQPTADMPDVHLTQNMATQVEVPGNGRVQSVVIGDPKLVRVESTGNIISLAPKQAVEGETNLIVHYIDEDGDKKIYQYRVIVPK